MSSTQRPLLWICSASHVCNTTIISQTFLTCTCRLPLCAARTEHSSQIKPMLCYKEAQTMIKPRKHVVLLNAMPELEHVCIRVSEYESSDIMIKHSAEINIKIKSLEFFLLHLFLEFGLYEDINIFPGISPPGQPRVLTKEACRTCKCHDNL